MRRIVRLNTKNFKAFKEAEMDIAPLTVLVGANSSGKSTLIQALLLMKQSAPGVSKQNVPLSLSGEGAQYQFSDFKTLIFGPIQKKEKYMEFGLKLDDGREYRFRVGLATRVGFRLEGARVNGKEIGVKPSRWFLSEATPEAQELADDIQSALARIYYLGPLREEPRDTYHVKGEEFDWVGIKGEKTVDVLVHREDVAAKVGRWLFGQELAAKTKRGRTRKERFGIRPEPLKRGTDAYALYLYDRKTGWKIDIKNVGFGYSQLLPILTGVYAVPTGSLVILEQPEIHLNPGIIPPMTGLLAESIKDKKSFLVETHSEILILALQNLVAQGRIKPEDVLIYFVERDTKGSHLRRITLDEHGKLSDDWPEDFFTQENELIYQRYRSIAGEK